MNRWTKFSLQELREIQDLLSNNIENCECDCADDEDKCTVDLSRQKKMLGEIFREIDIRLSVVSMVGN